MTRIYVCRKCRKKYTLQEFSQNHFCRECGTYLRSRVVININSSREYLGAQKAVKKNQDSWLPKGYEIRKGQVKFIREATKALKNNEVFVGSAPCGIGKSLASLLTILPILGEKKLLISYRTRSQLDIFLKEIRGLKKPPLTISFFSKQDMCPLKNKRGGTYYEFVEECKRLKENCETGNKPNCKYFWKTIKKKREAENLAIYCAKKIIDPQETSYRMARQGFCAYEALKKILNKVQIFLGTYHYTFNQPIRQSLLQSWKVDLSDIYLIVDEAHNLPNFARDLLSDRITKNTIENALKETERFEHDKIGQVQSFLNIIDNNIFDFIKRNLGNLKLKLINQDELAENFLEWSGVSDERAAQTFLEYGEYVRQTRQELGYDKIFSYTHRVGKFMENFFQRIGKEYVHLIQKDWNDRIFLSVKSLDGREITNPVLRQAKGSIVMSGFLSPPLVYRDLILYDKKHVYLKEFNSPFPSENRIILAASDVSSRYEQRTDHMLKKWAKYLQVISQENEGNIAVFFTSYNLMNSILSQSEIAKKIIVEERKTKQNEIMNQLKASKNNALFGVMGGKFSEGLDYPNNLLTCVVTVGLPYATWNVYQKAMINYFDNQFSGKGRDYAYLTPAIFRLVQACGRVHRSAKDKGCIIMLDERVTRPNIKHLLPKYYQKEMIVLRNPKDCRNNIVDFWNKQNGIHKKLNL